MCCSQATLGTKYNMDMTTCDICFYVIIRGVGTGGARGHVPPPPPNFLKGLKVPFFVMKSALFVQANVAVNTKLTSKVPFLFGNFQVFKKNLVKNVQFQYGVRRENFSSPPRRRQHLRG